VVAALEVRRAIHQPHRRSILHDAEHRRVAPWIPADPAGLILGEIATLLAGTHPLADGDQVRLGNTVVRTIATPGHAPAHAAFAVSDLRRGTEEAWLVFTGDSLLVGDVGRPDLHAQGDPGPLALQQHASLRKLLELPDHVLVYPSHYGGSVCGRSLSGNPFSTIGFERRFNRALAHEDPTAFAHALLQDVPPPPADQAAIVRANRTGRPLAHA